MPSEPPILSPQDEETLKRVSVRCPGFQRQGYTAEELSRFLAGEDYAFADRMMVIIFCDLKGSTDALRKLTHEKFRKVQRCLFTECVLLVKQQNDALGRALAGQVQAGPAPARPMETEDPFSKIRIVIDKFMGDCIMLYVDCGDSNQSETALSDLKHLATQQTLVLVRGIVEKLMRLSKDMAVQHTVDMLDVRLGARIGIALGGKVILSVLGYDEKAPPHSPSAASLTVTGEAVNLAARLEHATPAEFLESIEEKRRKMGYYSDEILDKAHLHGTALGNALAQTDKQILDMYEVCEKRFQIRANDEFTDALEKLSTNGGAHPSTKLAWRTVPFSPRGFGHPTKAKLLGGNDLSELFRQV